MRASSLSFVLPIPPGPVVRHWTDRYYGAANLAALPLQHLVMLTANRTTKVDITLIRREDQNLFRLDPSAEPRHNFKIIKPAGETFKTDFFYAPFLTATFLSSTSGRRPGRRPL